VPQGHWAEEGTYKVVDAEIIMGCYRNPLLYCPDKVVNKAMLAVCLLRSLYGGDYTPPPTTGGIFTDVDVNRWYAPWVEQLYEEVIAEGCKGNPQIHMSFCAYGEVFTESNPPQWTSKVLFMSKSRMLPSSIGMAITALFLICTILAPIAYADQVTLEWDPVMHPDLAGYMIYYGTSSGDYDVSLDVGNWTSCTIAGLEVGKTYYFAVTANSTEGEESDFSNEVSWFIRKGSIEFTFTMSGEESGLHKQTATDF
jgi:hypothetical protein